MPAKLSDRIRYEKRLYKINNPKRLTLEELAKEAEALERDHLKAITELSELKVRVRHNIKNDGYGIECIDKVLGISEEAKQG